MRITVRYDMAGSDGLTRRQRNANFGVDPGPEVDPPLAHVWAWFWHLSGKRQPGFSAPSPISYLEIDAWIRRGGEAVTTQEIAMLMAMDDAYRATYASETATTPTQTKKAGKYQ